MKPFARWLMMAAVAISLVAGLFLSSTPSQTNAQAVTWTVTVFSDGNLTTQVWTGTTGAINYMWGQGAPIISGGEPAAAPVDGFSVRFTTTAFFTAGTYRFTMQVDDGGRAFVDGIPVINSWQGGSLRTLQQDYTFPTDGNHVIVVEMFDVTYESSIIFNWAIASGALPTQGGTGTGSTWYGEFFSNIDLTGSPVFVNTYPASGLNINWGMGSPGGTVPADNFSARFTRNIIVPNDMPQGVYTFYASADDSFRLYVDQALIFDHWGGFENQVFQSDVTLLNGGHTLRLEYRELTLGAYVYLTWNPPSGQNPVIALPSNGVIPGGTTTTGGGTTSATATPAITGITAIVNANVLNVRTAPDPNAQVIVQVKKGAAYPVSGRSADSQWVQLNMGGQLGWVMVQYVSLNGPIAILPVVTGTVTTVGGATVTPVPVVAQPTGVRGMVLGNLRVRSGPGTRYPQIGLMPWGTNVDILGRDGGHSWYQVNFNGVIGWAYAPWIKLTQGTFDALPYLDGTQPMYPPAPPTSGVIAAAYGNMRIRSGPGFQYPKIARAVWGTEVQVLARSSNLLWWKVRIGDIVGWSYGAWYRTIQGDVTTLPVTDQ